MTAGPVVSVVAPAGYGKTTLLSQWAERNGQAFAWVSVDEEDNDPKVLLTYVAEALNAVEPVGERVFDALASPGSSVPGSVVPRLGHAFASMSSPVVLVLDDVHLLHDAECRAALSVLADHVPAGSRLALAGRAEPPVRVARLRAEGKIVEIGAADLSLTREEASLLLRAAEVALGEDDVAELHRRTEGWAAGLYLAALYLREGGTLGAAAAFGGDDRFVSEYVESELLARIPRPQRVFLTRTAVLERMCAPLCEAVLGQLGSGATLADLAAVELAAGAAGPAGAVVPLPPPVPRHAAGGTGTHGARPAAGPAAPRRRLVPAPSTCPRQRWSTPSPPGTSSRPLGLVEQLFAATYRQGRVTTVQRWYRWLEDRGGIEEHPMAAVWASMFAALTGRPAEAERWADAVDRWQ